jgi:nitroreductase
MIALKANGNTREVGSNPMKLDLGQLRSARRDRYAPMAPPAAETELPLLIRGSGPLSDPNFQIFYRAPVLIVISGIAQVPFMVEDCALAVEKLMLAAHAVGLGTCWIGFSQTFFNTPGGKSALGIPATWAPVAPIIGGHPQAVREPARPGVPTDRKEQETRWLG